MITSEAVVHTLASLNLIEWPSIFRMVFYRYAKIYVKASFQSTLGLGLTSGSLAYRDRWSNLANSTGLNSLWRGDQLVFLYFDLSFEDWVFWSLDGMQEGWLYDNATERPLWEFEILSNKCHKCVFSNRWLTPCQVLRIPRGKPHGLASRCLLALTEDAGTGVGMYFAVESNQRE